MSGQRTTHHTASSSSSLGCDLWIMIIIKNIGARAEKKKKEEANITCHSYSRCSSTDSANTDWTAAPHRWHTTYSLDFYFDILIRRAVFFSSSLFQEEYLWSHRNYSWAMWFDDIISSVSSSSFVLFFGKFRGFAGFAAMMTDDTLDTAFLAIGRDGVYANFGFGSEANVATDAECVTFYNPFRQHTYAVRSSNTIIMAINTTTATARTTAATSMRRFMCINYLLFIIFIINLFPFAGAFFCWLGAFGRFIQSITLTCGGDPPFRFSPSTFIVIGITEQPSEPPFSSFRSFVFHLWSSP